MEEHGAKSSTPMSRTVRPSRNPGTLRSGWSSSQGRNACAAEVYGGSGPREADGGDPRSRPRRAPHLRRHNTFHGGFPGSATEGPPETSAMFVSHVREPAVRCEPRCSTGMRLNCSRSVQRPRTSQLFDLRMTRPKTSIRARRSRRWSWSFGAILRPHSRSRNACAARQDRVSRDVPAVLGLKARLSVARETFSHPIDRCVTSRELGSDRFARGSPNERGLVAVFIAVQHAIVPHRTSHRLALDKRVVRSPCSLSRLGAHLPKANVRRESLAAAPRRLSGEARL